MSFSIVHVPTPGDHYSASCGGAVMTVIYELSRVHAERGGATRIVVGHDTRHDYPVGNCEEVSFAGLPSTSRKLVDVASGTLGLGRRHSAALYRPALAAIADVPDAPVVVHNSVVGAALVKRELPERQVVLYAHNHLIRTYSRREARRALRPLDAVICDSEFLAGRLRAIVPEVAVDVVLNGVDVDRFRPGRPDADKPPTILFVGRVVPYKGPHLILEAAQRLEARGRSFRVRIVGSTGFDARQELSPYERRLRDQAKELAGAVEFQPFVDRMGIIEEYRSASICCVPSIWDEPCSLTLPESLACGLPTLATRRGGLPEVGGDATIWFDPHVPDDLARHLEQLLDDPSLREEWGARARARALTMSWQHRYEDFAAALGVAAA